MTLLKQSTAATIKLGPFVDSTDGVTPETALTIAQADIRLSKNGGAFGPSNNVAGATHNENGWYGVPLDTTDTATLGRLQVAVYEAGALPCFAEFMVIPANIYDSLVGGTDVLDISMTQILGTAVSAPATAGILDINVKNIANAAVATGTAQLGVNVVSQNNIDFGALQKTSLDASTPASIVGAVGSVTGAVGSVTGAVGSVAGNVGGNVTGTIGSLAAQAKTDVNNEVLDVITIDTISEMAQGAPPTAPTMREIINYLYRMWRNKLETTATQISMYDDAGTTVLTKSTISDDATTFTKTEYVTGP